MVLYEVCLSWSICSSAAQTACAMPKKKTMYEYLQQTGQCRGISVSRVHDCSGESTWPAVSGGRLPRVEPLREGTWPVAHEAAQVAVERLLVAVGPAQPLRTTGVRRWDGVVRRCVGSGGMV